MWDTKSRYIVVLARVELLDSILDILDKCRDIRELKTRLERMLVEYQEELRALRPKVEPQFTTLYNN